MKRISRRRRHRVIDEHAEGPFDCHKLNQSARRVMPDRQNLTFVWRTAMDKPHEMLPSIANLIFVQSMLIGMLVNEHLVHNASTLLYDKSISL